MLCRGFRMLCDSEGYGAGFRCCMASGCCSFTEASRVTNTHGPLSSSFVGLPYRILYMNHEKELLRGLWVYILHKKLYCATLRHYGLYVIHHLLCLQDSPAPDRPWDSGGFSVCGWGPCNEIPF